ncbi:MAG: type II secretion system protein [Deltaproteobacteria bacterium]|nr:type II secretion system protein [Deltaproteobacteria bacterium]
MKKIKNQKGMTLIESTLTIMILAIGFLPTVTLMQSFMKKHVVPGYETEAYLLAKDRLEEVLVDKSFDGFSSVESELYSTDVVTQNGMNYTRTVNVLEVSSSDLSTPEVDSGVKLVTVQVSFDVGSEKTIQVQSVVTDYI